MAGYISEFLAIVQKTSQNKRLLRQHGRSAVSGFSMYESFIS